MNTTIIVALIAMLGSFGGTAYGIWKANSLLAYKIDTLEKKVEKHNNLVEKVAILGRDMETAWHRIDELKEEKRYD